MEEEKSIKANNVNKERKTINKRMIIIISAIAGILLIMILLLSRCGSDLGQSNVIKQGVIDLPDKENAQQIVDNIVEEGMFQVFMNTNIVVNAENEANLLIQNSGSNHYPACVEIFYNEESIYKSDIIEPGYKLESDTLNKELEPGVYECNAYFNIVDPKTNMDTNKIGLEIILTKES